MANQELVNYLKEQFKAGAKEEDLKKSLLDIGWDMQNILDAISEAKSKTLIETTPQIPKANVEVKNITSQSEDKSQMNVLDLNKIKSEAQIKEEKTISPEVFGGEETSLNFKINDKNKNEQAEPKVEQVKIDLVNQPHNKKFKIILYVVLGIFFLGMLGLVGFLYYNNNKLEKQLVGSNAQQGDLEGQVKSLTQTINDFQQQIANLKSQNENLANQASDFKNQLLLFSPSTSSLEVVFDAELIYEKNQYLLKTSEGILVNIKNSKDKDLEKVLSQFVNQKIKAKGIRTPGLREITLEKINDDFINSLIEKAKEVQTQNLENKNPEIPSNPNPSLLQNRLIPEAPLEPQNP